jgi:hypothetical protein
MGRVVVALGGNALLKRGEPMTAGAQRRNARIAAGRAVRGASNRHHSWQRPPGRHAGLAEKRVHRA